MQLSDFNYDYPDHLIAHHPVEPRDHSRLLIRYPDGTMIHRHFHEIAEQIPEKSLLVMNDTRVVPCRLLGTLPTGGKVEIFLTNPWILGSQTKRPELTAIGRPFRKLRPGIEIQLAGKDPITCTILEQSVSDQQLRIQINASESEFNHYLATSGFIPLPPYIKRESPMPTGSSQDSNQYQTVYCQRAGSAAAPTAGLHFTSRVFEALSLRKIEWATVTLHVGLGTFAPVRDDDLSKHQMHREIYHIPTQTLDSLELAKSTKRPVIFVGTTSLRAVESFYLSGGELGEKSNRWLNTNLFIYPDGCKRYVPQIGDGIITNFHQPGSTLLMLIAALIGLPETKSLYKTAVENQYRLFSYGDSSLLWF